MAEPLIILCYIISDGYTKAASIITDSFQHTSTLYLVSKRSSISYIIRCVGSYLDA